MQIKLYSWTALCKMHNPDVDDQCCAYGIPKHIYRELAKHPMQVLKDTGKSYLVQHSWMKLYVPYSFVKEIIK